MPPFQEFSAQLVEKRSLTPDVRHLRLRLVTPAEIAFRAGQFIQLLVAPRVLRQYSLCSPPSKKGEVELCADVSPGGEGSRFIEQLATGDVFRFRGPFGVFVLPEQAPEGLLFVATGAGIAPIRSMISDLLSRPAVPTLRLLFGNRSADAILYDSEFRELARRGTAFQYIPTLSEPPSTWTGERGRVTDALSRWPELPRSPIYICGSPAMVDDVRRVLRARGVPEENVHFEKFF